MRTVDGQVVYTDIEQCEMDLADDELNRIERLKENLVAWFDECRRQYGDEPDYNPNDPHDFSDRVYFENGTEEAFDDLFHKQWVKQWEICRTINREKIPSCEALRLKMKESNRIYRNARDAEARLREANMAEAKIQGLIP